MHGQLKADIMTGLLLFGSSNGISVNVLSESRKSGNHECFLAKKFMLFLPVTGCHHLTSNGLPPQECNVHEGWDRT